MRKNQYYPFDDFISHFIQQNMFGEDRPWREMAKRMREQPQEQESEMLSYLTDFYRNELNNNGIVKSLLKFWQEVKDLHDSGVLTDDMLTLLNKAKAGNIKSAQVMMRACPTVIHLSFIAQTLRYVVSQYKYCDARNNVLQDVKENWTGFLPSRKKQRVTYAKKDLRKFIKLIREQEGVDQLQSFELASEALQVSTETIRKKIKVKGRGPGRPKA